MTTVVISDLHLGTRSQADVLRRPRVRELLFERIEEADEIVLLGDVLELREQPLPGVLDVALPFFEALSDALPGRRVTLLGGNHDHRVVSDWLEQRRLAGEPLGLEQRAAPDVSSLAKLIAGSLPRNELELAYPGVWLRPGTYATHGHYVDCHMTVPRLECIAVHATARAAGGLPRGPRTPDDYEAAITPLYAFAYALAQGTPRARSVLGMDLSRKVWRRIENRRGIRSRALSGVAIPTAVWALNRAGMGPFEAKLSGRILRESGLRAMDDVVEALGLHDAREVIFGHTHRPGPLPNDNHWHAGLFNTGSWLYEPNLLGAGVPDSPYWPGTAIFLEDDGPPQLRRLLEDATPDDLGAREAYV
jgi:predicted phosphodiesterase